MKEFCHIITADRWQRAQAEGTYSPPSLVEEGFIHCSYPQQVLLPANALYRGREDLLLLIIDPAKLTSDVRHDPVDVQIDGTTRRWEFPHIYGALNTGAVIRAVPFPPGEDGRFSLPQELEQ